MMVDLIPKYEIIILYGYIMMEASTCILDSSIEITVLMELNLILIFEARYQNYSLQG